MTVIKDAREKESQKNAAATQAGGRACAADGRQEMSSAHGRNIASPNSTAVRREEPW